MSLLLNLPLWLSIHLVLNSYKGVKDCPVLTATWLASLCLKHALKGGVIRMLTLRLTYLRGGSA